MKRMQSLAFSPGTFVALLFLFEAGLGQVTAEPQERVPRSVASRSTDFVLVNGTGPFNREVLGHGALPLRIWYTDEGENWQKPRRLQVFVLVYEAKGRGSTPGTLLTTWTSPEPMTTNIPGSATGEVVHDIPLLPGHYAFEVYLCDPDEECVDTGWHAAYHPDLSKYPGRVLSGGLCKVTVE